MGLRRRRLAPRLARLVVLVVPGEGGGGVGPDRASRRGGSLDLLPLVVVVLLLGGSDAAPLLALLLGSDLRRRGAAGFTECKVKMGETCPLGKSADKTPNRRNISSLSPELSRLRACSHLLEPLPSLLLLFPLFPLPLSAPSLEAARLAFLVGGSAAGCCCCEGTSSATGERALARSDGSAAALLAAAESSGLSW